MSVDRPGNTNLKPWRPGESGNPSGSSQRVRARAAAKRIGGLRTALRGLLDQTCPTELLATLTDEQRAAIDGDPTLGRFLAARLLTVAATARSIDDFLAALSLVASVDVRAEVPEPVTDLDAVLATFPRHLREPLIAALNAHREGGDPAWAFETRLHQQLDQAQRDRLLRAAVGNLGITKDAAAFDAALARLPAEDVEHLDRITTELRVQPVRDRIERESF